MTAHGDSVLIFGGTTEGRLLCEALAHGPVAATVCVATDYGRDMLRDLPAQIAIHVGRLDEGEMERMMHPRPLCVVDATHPYAAVVSENIRRAATHAGVRYVRLLRPQSDADACADVWVPSIPEAVSVLRSGQGNVLSTTGSKELAQYAAMEGFAQRMYARVLPTESAIGQCRALGLAGDHIIAMQGPFSQELNEAMIRQMDIRWLVTKDGGDYGGFMAKLDAARRCGIRTVVVGRPPEQGGYDLKDVLRIIAEEPRGMT